MNAAALHLFRRGRARLALDFQAESIRLMKSVSPDDWRPVAEAWIGEDGFAEEIAKLADAAKTEQGGVSVELWLPADQVLNQQLAIDEPADGKRRKAAATLIAQRTAVGADEIAIDIAPTESGFWAAAAVEKTVVAEAVDYARKWGFDPVRVTTRHADPAFAAGPDFLAPAISRPILALGGVGALAAAAVAATLIWAPWQSAPVESFPGPEKIALASPDAPAAPTGDAAPAPPAQDAAQTRDRRPEADPDPARLTALSYSGSAEDKAPEGVSPAPAALAAGVGELAYGLSLGAPLAAPAVKAVPAFAKAASIRMRDFRNFDQSPAPTLGPLAPTPKASVDRSARTAVPPFRGVLTAPEAPRIVLASIGFTAPSAAADFAVNSVAEDAPTPILKTPGEAAAPADTAPPPQSAPSAGPPIVLAAIDRTASVPIRPGGLHPSAFDPGDEQVAAPKAPAQQFAALGAQPAAPTLSETAIPAAPAQREPTETERDPRDLGALPAPGPDADADAEDESVEAEQQPADASRDSGAPQSSAPNATAAEIAVAEEEVDDSPGPGSVASAPPPTLRPAEVDMSPTENAVASAPPPRLRPSSIKPRPTALAATGAKTVRAPSRGRPAGPGVSNAATLRQVMELGETSLLGVFGKSDSRKALIRFPDGKVVRVGAGQVIDGWVVNSIGATSMKLSRGGESRRLTLVR